MKPYYPGDCGLPTDHFKLLIKLKAFSAGDQFRLIHEIFRWDLRSWEEREGRNNYGSSTLNSIIGEWYWIPATDFLVEKAKEPKYYNFLDKLKELE